MSNRAVSIISALLTFFILIALAVASVFMQMLVLNGASESQGFNAMSVSLVCQSVGLLLAVIIARVLPNFLITKFNWNKILVVIITVIAATGLGGILALIAVIISIPIAGIS